MLEKELWKSRGSLLCPATGLWRQVGYGKLLLPQALLSVMLTELHLPTHESKNSLMAQLSIEWYVPNLAEQVTYFLHNCAICQTYMPSPTQKVVMSTIPRPQGPFIHLHMDFIDMTEQCQRYRYILVIVCPFSKWIEDFPCVHADAKTIAKCLI